MNTFYVRLLLAFMIANFIVLGVSIFGTRALIGSQTRIEYDVDLDALQALTKETYLRDGANGIRALNNKYREQGLTLVLFENGEAPARSPRPIQDFADKLTFDTRTTFELPIGGEFLHSLPLIDAGIAPQTAVIIHQHRHTLTSRGPGEAERGPGRSNRRPGGPDRRPGDMDRGPGGPERGPGGRISPDLGSGDPATHTGDLLPGATRTTLFVYLGLLMVGIALAGWIVARNLTAPLRSVQTTINRFANGDMSARVGSHLAARGDDMGRLAEDFDHMADGVEEMLRGRDRLLHHLSHEMRSPLARLRFTIELARGEEQQDNTNLKRADREIDRLDALMGQMLQLARSENEPLVAAKQQVALTELINDTVERIAMDAEAARVTIVVKPGPAVWVTAQGDLLDRAFENVLRNAIKYSPENGTVTIGHILNDDMVTIDIEDQGPGVPTSEHAALFEPFYRASNSAPGGGYGLGLAIVANAMRSHGGRAEVQNGVRKGLLVRLRLPCTQHTETTGQKKNL